MRVLLDTNIVIHREGAYPGNKDIGILYRWLDNLHHTKCIHPLTVSEIGRLKEAKVREAIAIKLDSYNSLVGASQLHPDVRRLSDLYDKTDNDRNDSLLLNELRFGHVDCLITEDKGIQRKASALGVADAVFTIDSFIEKVAAENPGLADYAVLSVRKEPFAHVDLADEFFDTLKEDYPGFDRWFAHKHEEPAYVCRSAGAVSAFLYLKLEGRDEAYPDISPQFPAKRRLKIGTFKVALPGYKLGERFLKIVFDNALRNRVDEAYATILNKRPEQLSLTGLLEEFGFTPHGIKRNDFGDELVYVRNMAKKVGLDNPKLTFPYFSRRGRAFIVPIYPEYHTNLFPDSILRTESPADFVENEPFRNAIGKVYISRSHFKDIRAGDVIVFYRTGGFYRGVITTIGIVEGTFVDIPTPEQFIALARNRSIFSDDELLAHWNYIPGMRPFIVNFLYAYSFPRRINLKRLIEIGVVRDIKSVPRGFEPIPPHLFNQIIEETDTDEAIVVD